MDPEALVYTLHETQDALWLHASCVVAHVLSEQASPHAVSNALSTTLPAVARNAPAIVLAAGRGERLRPFTDATPKPLLKVRGKALIEWHLEALARAGVQRVVINTAWLEEQFAPTLGDGSRWGVSMAYSHERRDNGGALETAGGIAKALPLLGSKPSSDVFWVVSGDVFLPGFAFAADEAERFARDERWLAKLWLAPNAAHHAGDFGINTATGHATTDTPKRTWASVGLFRAGLFKGIATGTKLPLRPLLDLALAEGRLAAEAWDGGWTDVGTLERWRSLDANAGSEHAGGEPAVTRRSGTSR